MRITLRQLECFVAVCDAGRVTAAAERLHLAQPTVSAALADLEASLGVQLLLRHHARGVSPTPAGRELLPDARAVVRAAAALEERAAATREELTGAVDVGVLLTVAPVVAPGLARSFETRLPQIELRMAELGQDELIRRLADGRLAVAVTYDLELPPEVTFEAVASLPPYAVVPATHRAARHRSVDLATLAREPFVMLDLPLSRDYFLGLFDAAGIVPRIRHATSQPELVRSLVANGYGFSIGNARPAPTHALDGRPLASPVLRGAHRRLDLGIAQLAGVKQTRAAAAFVDHARVALAATA